MKIVSRLQMKSQNGNLLFLIRFYRVRFNFFDWKTRNLNEKYDYYPIQLSFIVFLTTRTFGPIFSWRIRTPPPSLKCVLEIFNKNRTPCRKFKCFVTFSTKKTWFCPKISCFTQIPSKFLMTLTQNRFLRSNWKKLWIFWNNINGLNTRF